MIVKTIDHNLLNYFKDRVEYARMRRAQGIVVCHMGHEIPMDEYPEFCTEYEEVK